MQGEKIIKLTVGPVSTNCWIYRFGAGDAAIIDPGDEAELIISTLEEFNLCPRFILLTHGHFDHIAAVSQLIAAYKAEKPKIAVHRLDAEYIGPGSFELQSRSLEAAVGNSSLINSYWKETPPPDILLEEDGAIGPFTALHLPGHTRGSCAFWDKEEGVLFTGDTLFKCAWGRTDLPGGSEEQIMDSLRRLFKMDRNIKVYPGHGETTAIGIEADYFSQW